MEHLQASPPFSRDQQLCTDLDAEDGALVSLPGHPSLTLGDPQMKQFLDHEFWAQDLETLAPNLWVMTTHSSQNIKPLHHQRVKGREIVVTEEPRLHLVWFYDRIFIKPLPKYILSQKFWELFLVKQSTYLGDRQDPVRRAALGYLRTYRYLIRHESDFNIAKQDHLRLVPQDVDWASFCRFICAFDHIEDIDVSPRYSYGELRLSRLNFYAPFFLGIFNFERIHGQYGDYFARFYGPVLFIFAMASIFLNAMQVELAVDQVDSVHWSSLWAPFRYFSLIVLIGTAILSFFFICLWSWLFLDEWIFTLRARRKLSRVYPPVQC